MKYTNAAIILTVAFTAGCVTDEPPPVSQAHEICQSYGMSADMPRYSECVQRAHGLLIQDYQENRRHRRAAALNLSRAIQREANRPIYPSYSPAPAPRTHCITYPNGTVFCN